MFYPFQQCRYADNAAFVSTNQCCATQRNELHTAANRYWKCAQLTAGSSPHWCFRVRNGGVSSQLAIGTLADAAKTERAEHDDVPPQEAQPDARGVSHHCM
jgi:hypothetical protein